MLCHDIWYLEVQLAAAQDVVHLIQWQAERIGVESEDAVARARGSFVARGFPCEGPARRMVRISTADYRRNRR